MKTYLFCGGRISFLVAVLVTLHLGGPPARAQGTAFTYQGRLTDGGAAFTGNAEIVPTLWSASSGGAQVAANNPASVIVGVTNGLFVLPLDFGANFPGADRWLQLQVRTAIGPFTTLTPRQPITPTPYAITASNLTGRLAANQLSGPLPSAHLAGTYSSAVTFENGGNRFAGDGSGLTALNASELAAGTVPEARLSANIARTNQVWQLGGNAGTVAGSQFVGTTDSQPLTLKVNNVTALRFTPGPSLPNIVAGLAAFVPPLSATA